MNIHEFVTNELVQDDASVWVLRNHEEFRYSDGIESERYLEKVFRSTKDLSNGSAELESYIKDWPSEYHLTAKRAHLFAGFEFDSKLKVLEVGCGCGAITRYLGETFDNVISIEGSIQRARLARLRTGGLENVTIICAPFQEIGFSEKFDVIFCVGVYEYSASFVPGGDPYDAVLRYFSELLNPNGIVVIAIENQFGLKYFNSSREDHTAMMYEGLQGYRSVNQGVKTFGRNELEENLRKHFQSVELYYPYPDYKIPSCVISGAFLKRSSVGELVSQIKSRDYYGEKPKNWDEALVSLELARNGMLPFFSNSFLAIAGKSATTGVKFGQLAVLVSSQRAKKFRTVTRIYDEPNGRVSVSKKLMSGETSATDGVLTLRECLSSWKDHYSLQTELYLNCMLKEQGVEDVFAPCRPWLEFLLAQSIDYQGERVLDGKYVDCIFPNVYSGQDGIEFVDDEWVWGDKIAVNILVIRAIFRFIKNFDSARDLPKCIRRRSMRRLIKSVSDSLGVQLKDEDFSRFVMLESELQRRVTGVNQRVNSLAIRWELLDRPSLYLVRKAKRGVLGAVHRIRRVIVRIVGAAISRAGMKG